MIFSVGFLGLAAVAATAYTLPFVGLASDGYQQSQIRKEIREVDHQNESLRAALVEQKGAPSVESFIRNSGMVLRNAVCAPSG